jgi:signal transduction histidine kinase
MTRLVDDLLDASRVANGSMQLQRSRIDLRVVVEHAIETVTPQVEARSHELTVALPDEPVWLMADPFRLEQVFVNLLANAARYTDHGGRVAAWVHAREGQALIRIRDSGVGMAPQLLTKVFDLFRQADAADPHSRSGLGIGLAVVRSIVELHGGSVTAASRGCGHGSEFTVCLPRED